MKGDGHVRVLPVHVANKIAAGEVVERPASVVKELVENSLDAGARKITVTIAKGGRKLVAVEDDGSGMTREDAMTSLESHATSKITDVDDIEAISTLGFRGEAIPSIASVSRFSMTTRTRDSDEGTLIEVDAGERREPVAAGCPPGTRIEVRDLFCNVPARQKFLRAVATEETHVRQIFTVHALAYPAIAFTLIIDGREVFRLAPASTLAERVRELFGAEFLDRLAGAEAAEGDVTVSGFFERPNRDYPTRRDQYIFVNGRPASASAIGYAIREAYPARQGDAKPAAILFVNVPPAMVDVNVHPTKREVRFRDPSSVRRAVAAAIANALAPAPAFTPPPAPAVTPPAPAVTVTPGPAPAAVAPAIANPPPGIYEPANPPPGNLKIENRGIETREIENRKIEKSKIDASSVPTQLEFAVRPDSSASKPWRTVKFLATTSSGEVIVETDAGLVFVNPKAALERIAYERFLDRKTEIVSQHLLLPATAQFSPPDFARLSASLEEIRAMGFELEEFGKDTFKVESVPQQLADSDIAAVLASIAGDLAESGAKRTGARWREELIAKSIARNFAAAGTKLDEKNAMKLVEELAACRMPYLGPRGKPTLYFLSARELRRRFGLD